MADPTLSPVTGAGSEASGAVATAENAAGTAGRFVANAAKAVVESVRSDAVTLVANDASLGARVEAGLNLVADASSFVVGPEDAAGERAAVFAVKEAAEHGPQLAEAAAKGVRAAVEAAPAIEAGAEKLAVAGGRALESGAAEAGAAVGKGLSTVGKGAETAFERLESALKTAGHTIEDSDPAHHFITTAKSVWHAVEGAAPDYKEAKRIENVAEKLGKEMKTFAPNIESGVEDLMREGKDVIAKTEMQLTHALQEKGIVKEGAELAEHGYEKLKKVMEVGKTLKEGYEHLPGPLKKTIEHAAVPAAAAIAVEGKNIAHGAQHLAAETEHAAHEAVNRVGQAVHEAGSALESAGHSVADGAKKAVDAVENWHPSMSFDQFGSLMARIRGGSPAREPAQDPSHTLAQQPQHRGVDR